MASAKQIAWRKKFARMSKAGKFKKSKKSGKLIRVPPKLKYTTAKKSKFDKTGKKKDMVAGVDYYKDMRTLLGTAKKPKTKSWKSKK